MKQINVKKLLLPNLPYVFIALFATKLGQAARLSPGADFSAKALHIMEGFAAAFQSALPSFHPIDLCVGVAAALLIRLAVYVKGKNARKFRKNIEYGSARWGNAEDIKPYTDPTFANNVILTQTERLTMNSRPKDPKTARNKNVLVVGGSGSGKTRFFIKPNLMQLHSSYVVTDPKGSIVVECGKLLQRNQYKIKILNTINFTVQRRMNMSELTYTRCGDYYIPDLKLSEQPEAPIGKYGRMRQRYLKEHRPGLYSSLILSEKLYPHLLEIDRAARERMDAMLPRMMEAAGVTEELKARDPMCWVGLINTLKAQAEENIISELIFL